MQNTLLNNPLLSRLRRNHALEHATMNVLSKHSPQPLMAGYSDPGGFWIIGAVDTQDLQLAVDDALARLQDNQGAYAIHPHCGTNFVISGLLAGSAAWLAMLDTGDSLRRKLERLPLVALLVTLALMVAQPLGPLIQARYTTLADPGRMRVTGIMIYERGGVKVHRVSIQH